MQVFKRLKNHSNISSKSQPRSLQSCRINEAHLKALHIIPFIQWGKKIKPNLVGLLCHVVWQTNTNISKKKKLCLHLQCRKMEEAASSSTHW